MVSNEKMLADLQRDSFDYFLNETNPVNGLIADKTCPGWPASIAAVGLGLAAYPIGVEQGFCSREDAVRKTLTTLRFFRDSHNGPEPDATGYKGFYYHFLDMATGRRAWASELSTVDSAFLLAGMLTAAAYFEHETESEAEIRAIADQLYRRADWRWAQNGGATLTHGWKPETGFLTHRWEGYDEALLLYILALGSPTYPISPESYAAWASTYEWRTVGDLELLYAGPLFIHQLSHLWVDFRGIQDEFMRLHHSDYFENSRRAACAQRDYAIQNPLGFEGYGENSWGFTASDGPGPKSMMVRGVRRKFLEYAARGAPFGLDDGTIAPWAVVASLPFAPEIVIPAIRYFHDIRLRVDNRYGFKATFNPTFPSDPQSAYGWRSEWHYGINEGPNVLMIENFRSGFIWNLMKRCPYISDGLRKAGFSGGWL